MLDIKLIREQPEMVKANLAKRNNPECLQMLDSLTALDKEWRVNLTKLNDLRHDRKQVTIEIAKLKKAKQDAANEVMIQRVRGFATAGRFLWPLPDRGLSERLYRVKAPTLLLWGTDDTETPPWLGELELDVRSPSVHGPRRS